MRLRAEYKVGSDLKFLGTLDMMNMMGRALRRASIPFALSEGFNPHIKFSMGTVLPVGVWGENEYFDIELAQDMDPVEFVDRLNKVLPDAMKVKHCLKIKDNELALMKVINAACYTFVIKRDDYDILNLPEELMSSDTLIVAGRGKKKGIQKDLRPGIYKITINYQQDSVMINTWVNVGEPVNVRYDELLDLLIQWGVKQKSVSDIYRSANYIRSGSMFYSPLEKVR